jgi:uncharacterized metal-binding protein YceD (DUF177 family)
MKNKEYIIPFVGLKLGDHQYEMLVDQSFFNDIETEDISNVNAIVNVHLTKRSTFLEINASLKGGCSTICDRCGDDMTITLENNQKLIVKFGDNFEDNDEIIVIPHHETEIDIKDFIYQMIMLAIPLSKKHDIKDCNQETIAVLNKIKIEESEDDSIDEVDEDKEEDWNFFK